MERDVSPRSVQGSPHSPRNAHAPLLCVHSSPRLGLLIQSPWARVPCTPVTRSPHSFLLWLSMPFLCPEFPQLPSSLTATTIHLTAYQNPSCSRPSEQVIFPPHALWVPLCYHLTTISRQREGQARAAPRGEAQGLSLASLKPLVAPRMLVELRICCCFLSNITLITSSLKTTTTR